MVKNPLVNAGDIRDAGSTPGSGRSPGGGQGSPLRCSRLENPRGQRSLTGYSPWGPREGENGGNSTHTEAGDTSSTPGLGRSHAPRSYCICVPQLLSLCSRARGPQLERPTSPRGQPPLTASREKPAQQQRLNKQISTRRFKKREMPTPTQQWHLNPLGPFLTLFFMTPLSLRNHSVTARPGRSVITCLLQTVRGLRAFIAGWSGEGLKSGGNFQKVCSCSNPEAGRADPSHPVRISIWGCSGVGKVLGGTPVTPLLNYKSKVISSKCSSFHSALRARAVQMAGLVEMKTIFLVTSS